MYKKYHIPLLLFIILAFMVGCSGDESVYDEEEKPYHAKITSPVNGAEFPQDSYVAFSGILYDSNDTAIADATFRWTSSIDGEIGTGASFASINTLSSGTHTITLTAESGGAAYSATIKLTITEASDTTETNPNAPEATITYPADGATFEEGDSITFTGTGNDVEDGFLSGDSFIWTSSKKGIIGTGATIPSVATLSAGDHTITLTVSDSGGAIGTDSIQITVISGIPSGGNNPPSAQILYPSGEDLSFAQGDSITFSGRGYDEEDGSLEQYSPANKYMVWTSSKNGTIGVGTGFTVPLSTLEQGTHIITLTVTDLDGATGTDSITITVGNTAPIATIIFPSETDQLSYNFGNSIIFDGQGTDEEDGNLIGNSLEWNSSIDGIIGTGTRVETSLLSQGTHNITLTATDSDGATGSDVITITVGNTIPVPEILSPADGAEYAYGASSKLNIILTGTATDNEDGILPGTSLEWYSSIDGSINTTVGAGNGTSVVFNNPSIGTHVISLTATDSDFATGTATINITITE